MTSKVLPFDGVDAAFVYFGDFSRSNAHARFRLLY